MTMWHVLAPHVDGGHNSLDYRDDLTEALDALRYWKQALGEDMAIARGVNGEPLRWVFWVEGSDQSGLRLTREVAVSVHRTQLGAKRAYLKYGRRPWDDTARTYGYKMVADW